MITVMDIAKAASEIIFSNEGGYTSINRDDNGALSIGKLQWHGDRARDLLLLLCAEIPHAESILGEIYDEIASGASFKSRVLSEDECTAVRELLSHEASRTVQDALAIDDICSDIKRGIGYGLSQCGALMYFASEQISTGDIQDSGKRQASDLLSREERLMRYI